ncbi:MAG: glycosyltransferase family 9 protein [Planctomycetes bacterium]|nr:glycosyltransferase family 9 protein [Planctomycetota bacterium]
MSARPAFPRLLLEPAPRRVLLVPPRWVGDLVAITAVLEAAAAHFAARGAEVAILTPRSRAPLFAGGPLAQTLLCYEGNEPRAARAAVRARAFDLGILFATSFGSAYELWRAGVATRIGFGDGGRRFLLSERLAPLREGWRRAPYPAVRAARDLVGVLGIDVWDLRPRLYFDLASEESARATLASGGLDPERDYVVVHPGGAFGPAKRWPAEKVAPVIEALVHERGFGVYVHGGPDERAAIAELRACTRAPFAGADTCAIDLELLKPIIDGAALVVTTDSAPRHFAAAFEVPCAVVMGPTSPRYTNANLRHQRLVRIDVDCGPCQRRTCALDHRCLRGIETRVVLEACEDLLRA